MENIHLYIGHINKSFAKALARSLSLCGGVDVYRDEFPKQMAKECIVLSFNSENTGKYARYVQLTLRESDENLSTDNSRIYLYTSAALVIEKLRYIFSYGLKSNNKDAMRCKLVAFVSERSFCGVSTCALGFNHIMGARYGINAVYLSLCPVNYSTLSFLGEGFEYTANESEKPNRQEGSSVYTYDNENVSMAKFMYSLMQKQDLDIESYIRQNHGIRYFNLPLYNSRLADFDLSMITEMQKSLYRCGYEYLLIDIGTHLNRQTTEVVENSDMVIFVNCIFMDKYLSTKGKVHSINIDVIGDCSDAGEKYQISYCKAMTLQSLDQEYGFELERFLEEIIIS